MTSRFSEPGAPATMGSPRFTEHIHNSPPYQAYPPYGQASPPIPEYADEQREHRLSNKEGPRSPEIYSPGLESIMADEGDKEVASQYWARPEPMPQSWNNRDSRRSGRRRRTVCGLSVFWSCILVAAIIAIVVGLGVGLGIGLNNDRSKDHTEKGPETLLGPLEPPMNSQYLIGGAIHPSFYSTTGAFNGSGIALASQSFAGEGEDATHGSLVMYFQHHSGEIRYVQLSEEGEWVGGSTSEIVAVDAKNNTPLSAVAYSVEGINYWHIFYIDQQSYLRQRTNSNETNAWSNGSISDLNLQVFDANQVGMQACWYGNDYGDSDYVHTPLPSSTSDSSPDPKAAETGMHMWFASSATTFEQYGWRFGSDTWTHQRIWTGMNGHAGVACYSWADNSSVTYAMFVNQENAVEIWWRDTNLNHTETEAHPLNEWTNTSVTIPNAHPASSLGFTNFLYHQDASTNMILGNNITFAAENTSFVGEPFTVGDSPGIGGTHLSVSALPDAGGGNTLTVFFQMVGDEVVEWTRDWVAGQWGRVEIPIEDA